MIKTQFNFKIKIIRSDDSLEFTSNKMKELLEHNGNIHHFSCPYTPQQKSRVEKKYKNLLNIARALKIQAKIPLKYWGSCVLAANYIINRIPSVSLNNKTPFEVFNSKISEKHWGVYALQIKIILNHKLCAKTIEGIFMDYPKGIKRYLILDIKNEEFIIN